MYREAYICMMKHLSAKLTYSLLYLLSLLPFPIIYLVSDFIYLIFFHLTGYRKTVVFGNLRKSFPDKEEAEIKKIAKEFYKHLSDIMVESIKSFSISKSAAQKRMKVIDHGLMASYKEKGQNIIAILGHAGNWELFGLSGSSQLPTKIYSLYRKIKNPILNDLIKQNRKRFGLDLISEREAYKGLASILGSKDQWNAVTFLADQSAHPKRCVWVDFLHQKTNFVKGPALYAKKHNVPILFYHVRKVKRGFYEAHSIVLIENPSEYELEEMMQKFATSLEQEIINQPFNWLWSHKRWKHKYQD